MVRSSVGVAVALMGLAAVFGSGCAAAATEEGASADSSEDQLVATFDKLGKIDVTRTSRILLVGDSDGLGELPLYAATTRARRYAQLYPNEQIVLFITRDEKLPTIAQTGTTLVKDEPFGAGVSLADLSTLTGDKLVAALHRFPRIASLDFFGHSSPFGALLESGGTDRNLGPSIPTNMAVLGDNFARDLDPYVTLNGCNAGTDVAPQLSRLWHLPVAGALTASNFQVLMDDGHWYFNDKGFYPSTVHPVTKNDRSFGSASAPSCSGGACVRMKPQDSPYYGVWSRQDTGFQFGLSYYKFFCDFDDEATCARGMMASLYAWPSVKPIDRRSSDADVNDVLADFFCSSEKDGTWFDTCKAGLLAASTSGAPFSPMKSANDYTLECDFAKCQQKFRCAMVEGVPQQKSCAWVDATCKDSESVSSCKSKNTVKQTTNHELARYREGHKLLRGN